MIIVIIIVVITIIIVIIIVIIIIYCLLVVHHTFSVHRLDERNFAANNTGLRDMYLGFVAHERILLHIS